MPHLIFTHDAWSSNIPMCGAISYTATFNGEVVDETSVSGVTYDQESRSLEIYSEDRRIIGERTIEVTGFFRDYEMIQTRVESTIITILDPCIVVENLSPRDQISPATYLYAYDSPPVDFIATKFVAEPHVCTDTIEYSCSVISGPRTDLCAIAPSGDTSSLFDPESAHYTF